MVVVSFNASSQKVKLSGVVIDSLNKFPLPFATVQAGSIGTITDLEGKFELSLEAGSYQIEISYVGFELKSVPVELNGDEKQSLTVYLNISENLLKTATVTGSRYEKILAESVVSIEVLKKWFLENSNITNVEEVFSKIPGVQMLDGQPNIRGGAGWSYNAGNRVMLLIDDIPALQPDAGRAQWTDIPVENIAQIEVIKGAGSTLYGSAAMNGVINVRTAYATSQPETHLSLFHTRYDGYADKRKNWYSHTPQDYGMALTHKQKFGKWDIVGGAFYFSQDSTKTYRQQDFRYKLRGNLGIRYRASDRVNFGLNTIVNKGRSSSFFLWKNGSSGALLPFDGTVTRSENIRYIIDPFVSIFDKKNNRHKLHGRIYYNDNDNNLNQSNRSFMIYGEYQYHRMFEQIDMNLTAGVVSSMVDSDAQLFGNADISHNNAAAYFQLDKQVGEKLNLSGGLRFEYNKQRNSDIQYTSISVQEEERSEGQFIGRFGANYELGDHTFLRASVGQGYRYPILIERFLFTEFGGFRVLPNPELVSERGFTAELGIKQGYDLGSLKGYVDVAGFIQRYQNMMEFTFVSDPTFGFKALNIGDTQISGFEIGIAGRLSASNTPVSFYGGYNFISPKYQEFTPELENISSVDDNILKYRTRHSFTMDIQVDHKPFMIGFALRGSSHVIAIDAILESFVPDLRGYRELNNQGYLTFDSRIGYSFKNWKVSIHLKNAFNDEYTLRPALIEPPRNIALRLDFKIQG